MDKEVEVYKPTPEDLDWSGLSSMQKRDLFAFWLPTLQANARKGITTSRPVGITACPDLVSKWNTQVNKVCQRAKGIDSTTVLASRGRELHSNPDQRAHTRRTTLKSS